MKTEDIIFELDCAFAFMWNEYRQTDKREREIEEEALALAIDALNCKDELIEEAQHYEKTFKVMDEEITELKELIEYLENKLYFKQNPWEIDG